MKGYTHTISLDFEETLQIHSEYPWKNTYLVCVCPFLLLGNTHLYLSFYDCLGFTEFFPFTHGLYPVGLEEFHQTPTMVSVGTWRLITNWARHLVILLWGRLTSVGVHKSVLDSLPQKVQPVLLARPQVVGVARRHWDLNLLMRLSVSFQCLLTLVHHIQEVLV